MLPQNTQFSSNDPNGSYSMEEMNVSAKLNSAHHIYYEVENTEQTQQQLQIGQRNQQQHQLLTSPPNKQNQQHHNTTMGIIYGFRTRHLSCIEENDSDSLHSSSTAISPLQIIKDVDEIFTKLVKNEGNVEGPQQIKYDIEVDCIRMIDEMRIYDSNYMENICEEDNIKKQATDENQYLITDEMVHALCNSDYNEQCQRPMPDIMTTSCYGTLNDTSYSDISDTSTPIKQGTSKQGDPIYATPEKRREVNRSFDSSFASLSSSTWGSGSGFNADSFTSSLDLKCMGTSAQLTVLHRSMDNKTDNGLMDAAKLDFSTYGCGGNGSGDGEFLSPAGEVCPEIAMKCLNATENDLLSIRRLLEHETSGSICPSCRISFDKGKRRKLIDTCGHERCYSCMFRNDQCPMCMNTSLKDVDGSNAQGYDTGIGGSTSTIVSPLGSPQPQLRSQKQRANGAASAKYMQSLQSISPENYGYVVTGKVPKGVVAANGENNQNNNSAPAISSSTAMEVPTTVQYTVTADIHNNNTKTTKNSAGNDLSHRNSSNNNCNGNSNKNNNNHTYSKIHATLYATPPTRRRFFNHKNLRNALAGSVVGHRRTASNGACPIDTASILSEGNDTNTNILNTSTCSDSVVTRRRRKNVSNKMSSLNSSSASTMGSESRLNRLSLAGTSVYAGHLSALVLGKIKSLWSVHSHTADGGLLRCTTGSNHLTVEQSSNCASEKQRDQLRARLGLLWHHDQNGNNSNTTASSSSSHNISPEQTLTAASSGLSTNSFDGSQLSMTPKEATYSLCDKLKDCSILDSSEYTEILPVKARKSITRRSVRTTQFNCGNNNKRSAIYKTQTSILQPQCTVQLPLKPLFFEVPLQEPDPPFIGRHWLIRELSNVLTATETPGVLINGNPGTGKTAFILQLVEYSCFGRRKNSICDSETDGIYYQITTANDRMRALSAHVVAYHFCQADANLTCLVPDFVHSLAAQLCQAPQLSAYRDYLLNEPHMQNILNIKECIADAERVMRMAILEPLTVLKRTGKISSKTCIILVDALCEAEYHRPDHGHTIVTFLAKMTQYFPSWLKVVATVRTQMMEFVKGLSYTKMTLDSWSSNDLLQKDMLDYITFRINNNPDIQKNVAVVKDHNTGQLKFIGHLQALTKGSMLYAKLILDLIERGQLVIKSTSYKVLPVSVAQIFLLHFNLRFPTISSFEKAAPILNVCLAALYPLTLTEIYYTICAMKTDELVPWDEFLERFKLLDGFLIKRIDNTYMFFHSSFREWLIRRDEGESAKFLCDFRVGHAAIAFRLSRLQALLEPEQTLELGHHMLKAHIYRNSQGPQSPRDMQAFWVCSVADNISAALGSLRNVYSPNLKVSRLILLAGASPHYRTGFMGDATILCLASHEGIVPMVSLLLEFGADVGLTNSQGCTPLILAALRGHCDVVRLLVAAGSSLGQTDITQRCALVHAARMGRFNVVKYLLACDWTPRPNTNDVNLNLAIQQALISAASQDHITIVEDLLDMENIDINQIEPTSGDLALTAAARNGCLNTIEILLSRGAKIDLHNKQYFTALGVSVKEGHWTVAEKLLQNGADIDKFVTVNQKTSLMIAAEEGYIEIMEMLIDKGANLETQDSEGFTALLWACLRGRQTAAKILIEKGCNKNHSDNNGRSALDLAAYQGSASLVLYLMEQGADIEHLDLNGMRPLDRAIACRNIQVVQVLLRRGAKLGPTTWNMAMGKQEILVVLLNKLLEDGNILYQKNRFQEAAQRYQYALRKISNLDSLVERSAIFAQLRINLLLNLSRCKRKLNDLDESIDLATQAIAQRPSSYEGYYARAKALMQNADFNEALADANEAMQKAAKSGVLPEVVEILKRIQTDLLARLTQDGRQWCGEAINLKSPHEITDL